MSKVEILKHVGKLLKILTLRESHDRDTLFAHNILGLLRTCYEDLRMAVTTGDEEKFFGTLNKDFYNALKTGCQKKELHDINESPGSLRDIINELKGLAILGNGGSFRDPKHNLLEVLNKLMTSLEEKERLLTQYLLIGSP